MLSYIVEINFIFKIIDKKKFEKVVIKIKTQVCTIYDRSNI